MTVSTYRLLSSWLFPEIPPAQASAPRGRAAAPAGPSGIAGMPSGGPIFVVPERTATPPRLIGIAAYRV